MSVLNFWHSTLEFWDSIQYSHKLFFGFIIVLFVCFMGDTLLGIHRHSKGSFESINIPTTPMHNESMDYGEPHGDYDLYSFSSSIHKSKPWYYQNGSLYPESANNSRDSSQRMAKLQPFEGNGSYRFSNQMMFIPPNYKPNGKVKTILVMKYIPDWIYWKVEKAETIFSDLKCPVKNCRLTSNRTEWPNADLVIFDIHREILPTNETRRSNQIYAFFNMESPVHTISVNKPDVYNWTMTYRYDSTIVLPYGKWMYYDPRIKQMAQTQNYALNKKKKVAWFVSNCGPKNGRKEYVKELQKHIQVDIYGKCGKLKCSWALSRESECFKFLKNDYKFYLAFENSNCRHYITEKLFENGLGSNVLPIVMGAPREDYEKYAPERSYIHVEDFKSPKKLAEYLHVLDKNDDLYNSYFKWKGTGEVINNYNYTWCRICAALHDDHTISVGHRYENVNDWWKPPGICTTGLWRDLDASQNKKKP